MNYFGNNSEFYGECIDDAQRFLGPCLSKKTKLIIQTGSGFDFLAGLSLVHKESIPYKDIPHFPPTGVKGHSGKLHVFGEGEEQVLILEGRFHGYEGRDAWELAFPIRVLAITHPGLVLLTNAVGSVNRSYKPGDLVMITNHINHLGMNPLRGLDERLFGTRFVPMDNVYDHKIYDVFESAVKNENLKIKLHRGTYFAGPGPSFETEKEVDMTDAMGGDMVGMSTVIEAIVARACGLRVSGLSLVTNYGCGRGKSDFTHEEVLALAKKCQPAILKLIQYAIKHYT